VTPVELGAAFDRPRRRLSRESVLCTLKGIESVAEEKLGSRVLLDNSLVRVWDDRVPVATTQHLHTHRRPYLAVVVNGESAETVDAEGAVLRILELTPGETYFFGPDDLPVTHALRNTGASEIAVVIIELLQ
jgi:hypothetical protein